MQQKAPAGLILEMFSPSFLHPSRFLKGVVQSPCDETCVQCSRCRLTLACCCSWTSLQTQRPGLQPRLLAAARLCRNLQGRSASLDCSSQQTQGGDAPLYSCNDAEHWNVCTSKIMMLLVPSCFLLTWIRLTGSLFKGKMLTFVVCFKKIILRGLLIYLFCKKNIAVTISAKLSQFTATSVYLGCENLQRRSYDHDWNISDEKL